MSPQLRLELLIATIATAVLSYWLVCISVVLTGLAVDTSSIVFEPVAVGGIAGVVYMFGLFTSIKVYKPKSGHAFGMLDMVVIAAFTVLWLGIAAITIVYLQPLGLAVVGALLLFIAAAYIVTCVVISRYLADYYLEPL